jgi:purine-binding chemotaxis protein CheW
MTTHSAEQFLSVFLGDQAFGIPILQIQDILRTQQLTHIPLAAEAIEGIMNLRGRIVTAINFRKRIHADGVNQTNTMSVVIEHNGELFSLIVDEVGEVLSIATHKVEIIPSALNPYWQEVATGVFQLNEKIIILLNPNALFQLTGGRS